MSDQDNHKPKPNDSSQDHEQDHDHREHHRMMARDFKRRFFVSLFLTIPVLVFSETIQGWLGLKEALPLSRTTQGMVQWALATALMAYGGWPFIKGLVKELGEGRPGMMTLIGLAITVAYAYSTAVIFGLEGEVFFWELATLIVLMLMGHWIEMRSVLGASGALEELVKMMPSTAHRITEGGKTEDVKVSELNEGDRVLVKPGEKVPVDGRIVEGTTSLDRSMLTGESEPAEAGEGDEVMAGAVNGESAVKVEVTGTGESTYLSQVVELVRQAQQSRSRGQDLADKAALVLTIVAVVGGLATLLTWWLIVDETFVYAMRRMVTVMVITCPHALGLAVPLVVAVSTGLAAKHGLFIRDRSAFERARNIDAVVFDKTGTLTTGRFGVTDVVSLDDGPEDELLVLAAAVESQSEHPIGRGIVGEAEQHELDLPEISDFKAIPGKGAQATVDGRTIRTVSRGYLDENDIHIPKEADHLVEQGNTLVFVLDGNDPLGAIALADMVRDESAEAVRMLADRGIESMMLTGDTESVAKKVAGELGIERYFAEVLPDAKSEKIREVKSDGRRVAMVGDGVNDAPALVEADLGVAIGAGTDVAMESADVVLVENDPRDLIAVIDLAEKTHRKMVQNLFYATAYNVVAIPLAAGVFAGLGLVVPPSVGAIIMSASTVVVAVNARLLRFDPEQDRRQAEEPEHKSPARTQSA